MNDVDTSCKHCGNGYMLINGVCKPCRQDRPKSMADSAIRDWDVANRHLGNMPEVQFKFRYRAVVMAGTVLELLDAEVAPAEPTLFDTEETEAPKLRDLGPGWDECLDQMQAWVAEMDEKHGIQVDAA